MTQFSATGLDLSRLATVPLFPVDHASILAARLAHLMLLWEEKRQANPALPVIDTNDIGSATARILTEEYATGEMLLVQMINDAAKALSLAQATGTRLEHLAATYHRTERAILVPATETTPAIYESDDELRARAQLAPEELADLGLSPGGYIGKVRRAFAAEIKDVRPIRRGGGAIELRVLGRNGDGTVDTAILAEIIRAFQPEGMTQSTDILTVFSAEVEHLAPRLTLLIPRGPDPETVKAASRKQLDAYRAGIHRIGATVFAEALTSAAHVGPAITVRLDAPGVDADRRVFVGRPEAAPYIGDIVIETEVV